jgi:hypothetical protein
MKRPHQTKVRTLRQLDIRKDLTPEQLAGIGAVAIAYHYAENTINRMIAVVLSLTGNTHIDVVTRINGVDGKIAIVKSGAKELGIPENIRNFMAESLGEGAFKLFKKYRDAIIHARILDPIAGIGELLESKGTHSEILLTASALNSLYDHLDMLRLELTNLLLVTISAQILSNLSSDDPKTAQCEAEIQENFAQAQAHRTRRLSLPPIPGFPSESELRELENLARRNQIGMLSGWMQSGDWIMPQRPPQMSPALHEAQTGPVPRPPQEGEKK